MIRGILTGGILGAVVSGLGLGLVSLSVPLPDRSGPASVLTAPDPTETLEDTQQDAAQDVQQEAQDPAPEQDSAAQSAPNYSAPVVEEPFNQIEPEPQTELSPDAPAPTAFGAPEAPIAAAPAMPSMSETETAPRPDPTADIARPSIAFPTIGGEDETTAPDTANDPLAPPAELQPAPMTPPDAGQSPEAVEQSAEEESSAPLAPSIAQPAPPPPALGGGSALTPAQPSEGADTSAPAPAIAGVAPPPPALGAEPATGTQTAATPNPAASEEATSIAPPARVRPQEEDTQEMAMAEPVAPVLPSVTTQPSGNSLVAPEPPEQDAEPAATPEPDTAMPAAPDLSRAIEAYAASFDPTETRPLMSVILIDDPEEELDRASVISLGLPVTIAIDPMREDAAEVAALYREAGFELALLATIFPEGAEATDVEVALTSAEETLPETVAILDTVDGRIQGDRAVLDAVVAAIGESGHGLVAFPQGLNAAEASATREEVPAATLFRELDDERERATVISRFLDRAAFAAVQEGSVIVLGHTYSETVTALYSWALGSRSESVALAPLSAVLLREDSVQQ